MGTSWSICSSSPSLHVNLCQTWVSEWVSERCALQWKQREAKSQHRDHKSSLLLGQFCPYGMKMRNSRLTMKGNPRYFHIFFLINKIELLFSSQCQCEVMCTQILNVKKCWSEPILLRVRIKNFFITMDARRNIFFTDVRHGN